MTYDEIMKCENVGKHYVTKIGYKLVVVQVILTGDYIKNLGLEIVDKDAFDLNFEEISNKSKE